MSFTPLFQADTWPTLKQSSLAVQVMKQHATNNLVCHHSNQGLINYCNNMLTSPPSFAADRTPCVHPVCREQAGKLCNCLRRADYAGSAELLDQNRELVWARDEISGGYPIHLASWQGMTGLVDWLAQFPGTFDYGCSNATQMPPLN